MNKALQQAETGQAPKLEPGKEVTEAIYAAEQPWDRLPGEPAIWYNRFTTYYLPQDPRDGRTIAQAKRLAKADGHPIPGQNIHNYAKIYQWEVRADAYDHHIQQNRLIEWQDRREKIREWEYQLSLSVLHTIAALLRSVGVTVEGIPEQSPPVPDAPNPLQLKLKKQLSVNDLKNLFEVASRISRLSTEMATEHTITASVDLNRIREERWQEAAPALTEIIEGEVDNDDTA